MIKADCVTDCVNRRVDWLTRSTPIKMKELVRFLVEDNLEDHVLALDYKLMRDFDSIFLPSL